MSPLAALAVNVAGVVLLAVFALIWRAAHQTRRRLRTGTVRMPSGRHVQLRQPPYDWRESGL